MSNKEEPAPTPSAANANIGKGKSTTIHHPTLAQRQQHQSASIGDAQSAAAANLFGKKAVTSRLVHWSDPLHLVPKAAKEAKEKE